MERRIRLYEEFIKKETCKNLSECDRQKLSRYHYEMMESFQHERIIHLAVTLFFTLLTVIFLFIAAWTMANYNLRQELLPLYILTILMAVMTGFYVRHYYYLENHIQGLYMYTAILNGIKTK